MDRPAAVRQRLLRAVLLALLGVLIALDLASWPVVLVVSVIEGGASAIFTPASTAALPGIVPDSQLEEAWADPWAMGAFAATSAVAAAVLYLTMPGVQPAEPRGGWPSGIHEQILTAGAGSASPDPAD